jgi:hypothetical protein
MRKSCQWLTSVYAHSTKLSLAAGARCNSLGYQRFELRLYKHAPARPRLVSGPTMLVQGCVGYGTHAVADTRGQDRSKVRLIAETLSDQGQQRVAAIVHWLGRMGCVCMRPSWRICPGSSVRLGKWAISTFRMAPKADGQGPRHRVGYRHGSSP